MQPSEVSPPTAPAPPATAPGVLASLELADDFFALIAARTGLAIRAKDREIVALALVARIRASGLSATAYLALLSEKSARPDDEWRVLTPALTNGESYFWRDRGQFTLLRRVILPQLAARRPRELRVWSAGCSTGEEAYSLAMLCRELFPDNSPKVRIIGTDLNEAALERARRGCYGRWSFRGVEPALQARYFTREGELWRVGDELRALVSFQQFNLCAPPHRALRDFDLITCRNVLIYLAPAAIEQIVAMFGQALREGGTLMTGHAELAGRAVGALTPHSWPESLVYQKFAPALSKARPTAATPTALPVRAAAPRPKIAPIASAPCAPQAVKSSPATTDLAAAQRAADAGDYHLALSACRAAIAANSFDAQAYLLWARIEIERGEIASAKVLLKKVVYLAPDQSAGFVELAALYEAENDRARAEKMRAIAEGLAEN